MGIGISVSYGLMVVGLVVLAAALRWRRLLAFVVWMVLGMVIAWYVLHVMLRLPFPLHLVF